jgi:general secretion pathway protein G
LIPNLKNGPTPTNHFVGGIREKEIMRRELLFLLMVAVGIAVVGLLAARHLSSGISSHPRGGRVNPDFNAIGSSLKTYRLNAGHYPTTEQGLKALVEQPRTDPPLRRWVKIMDRIPTDPWNTEYRYRRLPDDDPRGFEIFSAGKDRRLGTKDDLSSLNPKH